MASRKSPSAPEWQVILERMESQNRMTIEAVQVIQATVQDKIEDLKSDLGGRIGTLEMATTVVVGRLGGVEMQLRTLQLQIMAREEASRVSRLEERVAALEKRTG